MPHHLKGLWWPRQGCLQQDIQEQKPPKARDLCPEGPREHPPWWWLGTAKGSGMLGLGLNLARSPASIFREIGLVPRRPPAQPGSAGASALSKWQSSSWSPLQSKGKLEPEKYLPQSLMILQRVRGRRAGSKASSPPPRSLTESLESWPRRAPALVECDTHLRRGVQLRLEKKKGQIAPGVGRMRASRLSSAPHRPPPAARYSYPS